MTTGLVDVRIPPLGTWLSYPLQVMLNLLSPGRTCEICQEIVTLDVVSDAEEQQVSLESVDVYFQDVFGTMWCHHAEMQNPVYLIPETVPYIKWDNCNSTNITAVVRAQGLDVTLPLSLPTSAQDSNFSVKTQMQPLCPHYCLQQKCDSPTPHPPCTY